MRKSFVFVGTEDLVELEHIVCGIMETIQQWLDDGSIRRQIEVRFDLPKHDASGSDSEKGVQIRTFMWQFNSRLEPVHSAKAAVRGSFPLIEGMNYVDFVGLVSMRVSNLVFAMTRGGYGRNIGTHYLPTLVNQSRQRITLLIRSNSMDGEVASETDSLNEE